MSSFLSFPGREQLFFRICDRQRQPILRPRALADTLSLGRALPRSTVAFVQPPHACAKSESDRREAALPSPPTETFGTTQIYCTRVSFACQADFLKAPDPREVRSVSRLTPREFRRRRSAAGHSASDDDAVGPNFSPRSDTPASGCRASCLHNQHCPDACPGWLPCNQSVPSSHRPFLRPTDFSFSLQPSAFPCRPSAEFCVILRQLDEAASPRDGCWPGWDSARR